jgi:hypothetical protein
VCRAVAHSFCAFLWHKVFCSLLRKIAYLIVEKHCTCVILTFQILENVVVPVTIVILPALSSRAVSKYTEKYISLFVLQWFCFVCFVLLIFYSKLSAECWLDYLNFQLLLILRVSADCPLIGSFEISADFQNKSQYMVGACQRPYAMFKAPVSSITEVLAALSTVSTWMGDHWPLTNGWTIQRTDWRCC